jgi:Histidine kinase-, DNA gyrase B-, and HSP90-like ATPase
MFAPFFTTKSVGKGTGMGLAISYQIIVEHKGNLSCTSILGQDTEFVIEIPVHQVPLPQQCSFCTAIPNSKLGPAKVRPRWAFVEPSFFGLPRPRGVQPRKIDLNLELLHFEDRCCLFTSFNLALIF